MASLIIFLFAIIVYYLLALALTRGLKAWFFPQARGPLAVRNSALIVPIFMTVFSLIAVVCFKKAALAMPGVYLGLVMSMILGGQHHGPGDPYSWSLITAAINYPFYYGLSWVFAKYF